MGGGTWDSSTFTSYSTSKGLTFDSAGSIDTSYLNTRDMYKSIALDPALSPKNIMRECCDSKEHPNTLPVVLALDVTGSMGDAAMKVAASLNKVMEELYKELDDVEFQFQAFGDLECDRVPIQVTQFESDIRIAEQLDKVYFEGGGGGNSYESYTLPWYMAAFHSDLDCWKRGKKGILITMGDEPLNPILYGKSLSQVTGDPLQGDIKTESLYEEVSKKYDVYHVFVDHSKWSMDVYEWRARNGFGQLLPEGHYFVSSVDDLPHTITNIIVNAANSENSFVETKEQAIDNGEISW